MTHTKTEKKVNLADGEWEEGVGEESNHTTATKPGQSILSVWERG